MGWLGDLSMVWVTRDLGSDDDDGGFLDTIGGLFS